MVASPVATLTTMGKKEIRNAVSTAGTKPIPNHSTRIGTTATIGNGVEADHQRIESGVDRARPADDEAEHEAESDGEAKADQRGGEREQRIAVDRPPEVDDGLPDPHGTAVRTVRVAGEIVTRHSYFF